MGNVPLPETSTLFAAMTDSDSSRKVRIDRWLWAARFFKTRSLAAKAVAGGKVQVNGRRAKPASPIEAGDRVRIQKGVYECAVVVARASERRGPAAEAARLYDETPESVQARERLALLRRSEPTFEFRDKGKPSKKQRRQLRRLKGQPPE